MNEFDDASDPEFGAACNRLAAWVESLPLGAVIDARSGLTERDLALILRHLHATRQDVQIEMSNMEESAKRYRRPSVPITAKAKPFP